MPTRPEPRHRRTARNRGIECLLLARLASGELQSWRFRINAIAAVAAILVWLASYDNDYLLPEGYFRRVLVWVGVRSYAIHLIHIPVYFLLHELGFRLGTPAPLPAWPLAALAIGLIVLQAGLNYRHLEQPLRERGRRWAGGFERRWKDRWLPADTPALLPSPGPACEGP